MIQATGATPAQYIFIRKNSIPLHTRSVDAKYTRCTSMSAASLDAQMQGECLKLILFGVALSAPEYCFGM